MRFLCVLSSFLLLSAPAFAHHHDSDYYRAYGDNYDAYRYLSGASTFLSMLPAVGSFIGIDDDQRRNFACEPDGKKQHPYGWYYHQKWR